MDGRGRVTARNWDFSQHGTSNSVPNTISLGYHETSLKMNSHNNESNFPSLDFQQWIPQRSFLSTNPQNPIISSSSSAQQVESQENVKKKKGKNIASKALKPKEPKKNEKKGDTTTNNSIGVKHKRNQNEFSEDLDIDLSSVPAPVCSCTGITRQCYRWGSGGWQSSCCTRRISEYPLPISESRPGARLSGRKMSVGAFKKVLHKLSLEGRDLACPVDLKDHWARHGTNKFVTIR